MRGLRINEREHVKKYKRPYEQVYLQLPSSTMQTDKTKEGTAFV
jgi:hypothetical protein